MGIPQIIILCLVGINLLLTVHLHGKPREGNNNFWVAGFGAALEIGLLYWGGFFHA